MVLMLFDMQICKVLIIECFVAGGWETGWASGPKKPKPTTTEVLVSKSGKVGRLNEESISVSVWNYCL